LRDTTCLTLLLDSLLYLVSLGPLYFLCHHPATHYLSYTGGLHLGSFLFTCSDAWDTACLMPWPASPVYRLCWEMPGTTLLPHTCMPLGGPGRDSLHLLPAGLFLLSPTYHLPFYAHWTALHIAGTWGLSTTTCLRYLLYRHLPPFIMLWPLAHIYHLRSTLYSFSGTLHITFFWNGFFHFSLCSHTAPPLACYTAPGSLFSCSTVFTLSRHRHRL